MNNKRLIIIGSVVALFIIIGLVLLGIYKPTEKDKVTDRDTGETVSLIPDSTGASSDLSGIPVVGLSDLTQTIRSKSSPGLYTNYIGTAIRAFAKSRLDNKFTTITIRPQGTEIEGLVIKSSIRLGQSDTTLPITITRSGNNKSMVLRIVDKDNKYGGDYVYIAQPISSSKLYSIDYTHDYKSVSDPIIITITASTSYREAALNYIRDLGFSPADFKIIFTKYENPFK